jgi:hypothetical protein
MPEKVKYAYEDLLEMLGGYQYYSDTLIDYIYHEVNHLDEEKTMQLLLQCQEQNEKLTNKFNRMTNNIEQSEAVIESKESI